MDTITEQKDMKTTLDFWCIAEWDFANRKFKFIEADACDRAKTEMRMRYKVLCVRYPNQTFLFGKVPFEVEESRIVNRDAENRLLNLKGGK